MSDVITFYGVQRFSLRITLYILIRPRQMASITPRKTVLQHLKYIIKREDQVV